MKQDFIHVIGAKEHNLKNISLKIPRNKLVVFTGISGSGKSSLAFDTIYAEGQRRYVETLSSYGRQFLDQLKKPDVETIEGLSAAIAIEQRTVSKNPRSTVGTITEIYDFLRLLFARIGKVFCPNCHKPISSLSTEAIVEQILKFPLGEKINILAPIVRNRKGEYQKELYQLRLQGFIKVKVDDDILDLSESIRLDKHKKHTVDVYVDRIILKEGLENRIYDSVQTSIDLAGGLVKVETSDGKSIIFSNKIGCMECGGTFPEVEPRLFSFNSPVGACSTCSGIGIRDLYTRLDDYFEADEKEEINLFHDIPCPDCHGNRLKKEALFIKIGDLSISDFCKLPLDQAFSFIQKLSLTPREKKIGEKILHEVSSRLKFLLDVGLHYIALDRKSSTLSGGEAQRIRLAAQIGSSLTGVLYILDEPSIGLHPRDNDRLITSLKELKNLGNTVIVIEHDEETIRNSDYIFDMGPGAGRHGGTIVSQGTLKELIEDKNSITGAYLKKEKQIPIPTRVRVPKKKYLYLEGAAENNLKNISIKIPLGVFLCVTGVSGSGKSSLIIDTLYRALMKKLHDSKMKSGNFISLTGTEHIDKVINIDQSPIGKTPRSNPSTYAGIFSMIRDFFSQIPESKIRGYKPGRYSFNVPSSSGGGRCETCEGSGVLKIEMHFLPPMYVQCEMCLGKRYNRETLDIYYKDKNISDVLNMTVEEALDFFDAIPQIKQKLKVLSEVGLEYIHLGQQATTLSGGEAQRIKLSKELSRRSTGKTLYILDEPTTGLHFDDIHKLLIVLQKLVDLGNTVIIIEHNLEVIKSCDYMIDMGPEGGEKGGYIIGEGTPHQIIKLSQSSTGQFLKRVILSEAKDLIPAFSGTKA